jgi:hypothetical protein
MNKLRKIIRFILMSVSPLSSNGICDLLQVSSTRSYDIAYDLTEFSGDPENLAAHDQYYSQGIEIYFSNTNDATWAEVIIPNGTSFPLSKYTKEQDQSSFQNLTNAVTISNSALIFSQGASFASRLEMDQFLPANRYVTVRFGGGDLGDREDQLLIADSSQFFNSLPELDVSTSTLSQLINYDSARELQPSVSSTWPWQVGIQDSKYKSVFHSSPLELNSNLIVPRYLLEPGLVYNFYFYVQTSNLIASNSFDGLTRSPSDPQIPMVSGGVVFVKNYYIKTLAPNLRLKQVSGLNLSNQKTRMDVQIESNPGYLGILEFTESLAGTPVWTSLTNTVSFGTNGTGNITLEKSGDLRSQWDKSLFFRVRNSRQPIETSGFITTP